MLDKFTKQLLINSRTVLRLIARNIRCSRCGSKKVAVVRSSVLQDYWGSFDYDSKRLPIVVICDACGHDEQSYFGAVGLSWDQLEAWLEEEACSTTSHSTP